MNIEFYVMPIEDEVGVVTYYAYRPEDLHDDGEIPNNNLTGQGETPYEAIANLCFNIDEDLEENDETDKKSKTL